MAVLISLHVPITMSRGFYVVQIAQCLPDFGDPMGRFIAIRVRLVYYVSFPPFLKSETINGFSKFHRSVLLINRFILKNWED